MNNAVSSLCAKLPINWQIKSIGSHIDLLTGPAFDSSNFSSDPAGVRLARGINITRGRLRWTSHITQYWPRLTPDLKKYLLAKSDVVIGMDGSLVGRNFAYLKREDVPSLLVQRVARIRTDSQLYAKYLYYFIASDFWLHHVDVVKTNSGIPHISNGDIRNFQITFPTVSEQHKIAQILTTLDNVIEKTEVLIAKYQAIKQGMMHDLFTRGIDANGLLRPTRQQAPDLYVETRIGFCPKAWKQVPLSHYADVSGGVTLGRKLDSKSLVELPYLRVANVQDGYLDLSEIKTVEVLRSEVDKYKLKAGDVVMTEGGDFDKLGRGTIWQGQIADCLHQNHVFRIRPKNNELLSPFLAQLTGSAYGRHYFLMCAKQTTNLASINASQVKAFPLLLPAPEEQAAIVAKVEAIDGQLASETAQRNKLARIKSGLMQDLLTGKVRVKVDESVEVAANA